MRIPSNFLATLASALLLVLPEVVAATPQEKALPPSRDPFYTAPRGYQSAEPGTVLRIRRAPGNLTSIVTNTSAAYNVLYRTTDSRYQPAWAVTTLFIPNAPSSPQAASKPAGGALLSYQIPYDSAFVDASPSWVLRLNNSIINPAEISAALGRGWYVNAPDYEGPLASFCSGVQSGHATLDSIRAVLSARKGLDNGSRVAMWGYSGGAIATEWATELQVQYAPELEIHGAAYGAPVMNGTATIDALNKSPFSGLAYAGFIGMTSQYPEARKYLLGQLKTSGPRNRTGFMAAASMTVDQHLLAYAFHDFSDYFINGISSIFARPLQKVFNNEFVAGYHGVPQMPLFVYHAIGDQVTSILYTDNVVNRFCQLGANILYQRNTIGEHVSESGNGQQRAWDWLTSVLDGTYDKKYSAEGCTIQDVTISAP